jgi:Cd2+/Zn2+-exporting ATPase
MNKQIFKVDGLDCPDCAATLEKALRALPEVQDAQLIYASAELLLVPAGGADVEAPARALAEGMGYRLRASGDRPEPATATFWWGSVRQNGFTLGGGGLLLVGLVVGLAGGGAVARDILYALAILVAGIPVAKAGYLGVRYGHSLDMNALMTIAALGAMAVGEYAEGAITMFLFSVGELLEGYTAQRARQSVRALMELAPDQALRVEASGESLVPVASLQVGDVIRVRPGQRVPADGMIMEGASALDQSPVTGESVPVDKAVGDTVFAATLNGRGVLTVQVTKSADDSTVARIRKLIEEAQAQRAPMQRFVDRFARVYTPIVAGAAVLIAFLPPLLGFGALADWGYRALVMLVIACPCALVISTPVTLVSALGRAAREGVLIKGGRYLEALARVRAIAFDKTGTLTVGRPQVVGVGCDQRQGARDCEHCERLVAKAAAVEAYSEHALGQAVREYAERSGLWQPGVAGEEVAAVTGQGIMGQVQGHRVAVGNHRFAQRERLLTATLQEDIRRAESAGNTVLVVEDTCCDDYCYLALADQQRPEAPQALAALRQAGVQHLVMLTGDNEHVAAQMAQALGLDEYHAALMPADKVAIIEALQKQYGQVAMVGDGVNDAPALARSTVGIAMGAAGTDVALETADVALMGDDLSALPFAISLSRRALGILRANIVFALVLKAVFLALAVGGVAGLWLAVLADTGAALLVSLNGLRLLRFKRHTAAE